VNTPENIASLGPNEIFVFGSNLLGSHQGGAARIAKEKFGAVEGQWFGLQGKSYAIPTLDAKFQKIPLRLIQCFLVELASDAYKSDKSFYLTKVGCGIAGYSIEEIRGILPEFPPNVILPIEFI